MKLYFPDLWLWRAEPRVHRERHLLNECIQVMGSASTWWGRWILVPGMLGMNGAMGTIQQNPPTPRQKSLVSSQHLLFPFWHWVKLIIDVSSYGIRCASHLGGWWSSWGRRIFQCHRQRIPFIEIRLTSHRNSRRPYWTWGYVSVSCVWCMSCILYTCIPKYPHMLTWCLARHFSFTWWHPSLANGHRKPSSEDGVQVSVSKSWSWRLPMLINSNTNHRLFY